MTPSRKAVRRRWLVAGVTIVSLVTASCADRGPEVCPTVMSYAEPVLTIDNAVGPDGRSIDTMVLSSIRENGFPFTRQLRHEVRFGRPLSPGTSSSGSPFFGLFLRQDESVVCRVPCGFGSAPGVVTFRASAPGGLVAIESVRAEFTGRLPGCGGAAVGGTHVELQLVDGVGVRQ